jgi:aminodeoxyfutalosine deaminase
MIVRAPVIVTRNGLPVIDGAVRTEGNRISQVSGFSEVSRSSDRGEIVDLNGHVLLPGLINAHCHLDYTCLRERIPRQKTFTDWIRAINAEKAKLTAEDYLRSIAEGSREAQRFGTTSIVNLAAFPELIARLQPGPLRIWWCAELIDVTAPGKKSGELMAAAMNCVASGNPGAVFGLAPHALYTASAELYRQCQLALRHDLLLTTHLAESREEMEMFRNGSGALFEFLQGLGRDMSDCDGSTPLQQFQEIIRDSSPPLRSAQNDRTAGLARWIIAHLNELAPTDFEILSSLPEKFSIAHCPRSHAYFQHSPFPFEPLRNLGFNICLATDSLASNTNLSLFAEMREFRKSHPQSTASDLLQMVTANPAKALSRADQLGKIAEGFSADMIALPIDGATDVLEQIIGFDGKVPWTMLGGKVL